MPNTMKKHPSIYSRINSTEERYPSDETISSLFRKVVAAHASATAIVYGERTISYDELLLRSSQVAELLAREGCGKGDYIGIYMERSPETVIAILGVLRLGAVYVPIDPEHPIERNRYIVGDAHCKQLLTKDVYMAQAKSLSATIGVEEPLTMERCFEGNGQFADPELTPDDLAYVIYTSGSTGKPKGTLIRHRGVVNLWNTFTQDLGVTHQDVVTQFSTFSFDASIIDTFIGLLNGAKLVILTKEEQLTPELFLALLERQQVTHIGCLPTSVFNRLSEVTTADSKSKWRTVKHILVGGEALLSDHVRKFQGKFGTATTIINAYGPTECTVITTCYKVKQYWSSQAVTVPIGKPIGNYKIYVVKPDGTLANVGEEGELYIETFALAKGYLNLPDKTNEVFIANPFSDDPQSMVYTSGDIVKLLPDGNVEFQYRKDGQLKLRGFRIEIGEIENALSKHPSVLDAAVIAVKDGNVVKHLSCFYSEKERVTSSELREHLKAYVPHYMIPSYFYRLTEIPLSPTGKVDRNKLLTMDNIEQAEQDAPYEEPAGELEQTIAAVWADVLGLARVSRNVSFFDIGGYSHAVMRVLARLKLDYSSLRLNDLYAYKTIGELAAHMSTMTDHTQVEELSIVEYKDLLERPALPRVQVNHRDGLGSDILLTGATGYLGSHILHDLLTTTDANIHVLVRPNLGQNAISRIWKTMDVYFGQQLFAKYTSRIFVYEGDLVSASLGLSGEQLAQLKSKITSIIHAGADVRHFGRADEFQATNVVGTDNLLNLVKQRPEIAFHFISTLGIPEDMAASGIWESVSESADAFYQVKLDNVYTNSKLLAEKLVAEAITAGLPCSIYRAGNLSCHSVTGHFQNNINENYFYRMVKSFLLLGKAPMVDTYVDITPIDCASSLMVSLMKQPVLGGTYHICNPSPSMYGAFIQALTARGYEIELMPQQEFERWVLKEGGAVSQEGVELAMALLDGDGVRTSPYRYSSAQSYLQAQEDVKRMPELHELVGKLVQHAVDRGYFPPATRHSA
ncbi:non-ribosomal peptide synthetase [Paenibacillus sp. YYML68]|uniref:non-ribosomal peptide synthetase family protein n=1 Tax=Paenibacillus sp. YYML68 TaxID=2909250 RepID=UPI0024938374|nr:non-ribosomal peptide synthetase [Paenibacillus sp. YYML68]